MSTPNPPDTTALADVYNHMRRLRGVGRRHTITVLAGSKTGDSPVIDLPSAFVNELNKNPSSVLDVDRYVVMSQAGSSLFGSALLNKTGTSFQLRVFRTDNVAVSSNTPVVVEWFAYPI